MANHQNTDMEREQLNQARQAFWWSALMHSTDIEKTYQELRQSLIETNQSLQKYLDATYEESMTHSLSLADDLSEKDKEEFSKEIHELYKNIGMDYQGFKAKLEQELTDLENIKNQVIATRKQRKLLFYIAIIIVFAITVGVYVLR